MDDVKRRLEDAKLEIRMTISDFAPDAPINLAYVFQEIDSVYAALVSSNRRLDALRSASHEMATFAAAVNKKPGYVITEEDCRKLYQMEREWNLARNWDVRVSE